MSGLHVSPEKPIPALRRVFRCWRTAFLLAAAVEAVPAQETLMLERFDTVAPPALPAGWLSSRNRNTLLDDFVSSSSAAHSPPNALLSTNATISQALISPAVSFLEKTPGNLSFALRRSPTHLAGLLVEASTDGGKDFRVALGDTIQASGETEYRTFLLSLPPLLEGLAEVRFRWRTLPGNDGASGTLRIDDVAITAGARYDVAIVGARCEPPKARASWAVTASVSIAGLGTEKLPAAQILFGEDRDGNGSLAGLEIWSCPMLASPPAQGETTEVVLEFRAPSPGEYRLTAAVDSPADQVPGNNAFSLGFISGYRRGTVVVNEIMYAPRGNEPEWIELLNADTALIPLTRWKVGDGGFPEGREITPLPVSLAPGGMVVITRSLGALAEVRPGCEAGCVEMTALPTFNNTGDMVILRDPAGFTVDSVCYLPAWGGSSGRSLERKDEKAGGDDGANWGNSLDSVGATPCRRNSIALLDTDLALAAFLEEPLTAGERAMLRATVRNDGRVMVASALVECVELLEAEPGGGAELPLGRGTIKAPLGRGETTAVAVAWENPRGGLHHLLFRLKTPGDMRIRNDTLGVWCLVRYRDPFLRVSEIMAAPRNDEAEYVEVMNGGPDVIDIAGWTIGGPRGAGLSPRAYVLSRKAITLVPGSSFVLASDSALFRRFAVCDSHYVSVAGTGSLQLNNDADIIVLRDPFGRAVDSVAYASNWHTPVLVDPAGRSLERISAALSSSDGRNWGTSVAGPGGTPGCPNSIRDELVAAISHLAATPNPFSPDGDGREDHTIIRFEIPQASGWMSIRIFDVRGRLIRFLANNEPCGGAGAVVWDGFDDARRRVRIGMYVILLEVAGQDCGTLLSARGSVVVAGKLR
jgi:hypothetical protein